MVISMAARLMRVGDLRFSIPDRSRDLLGHARWYSGHGARFPARVCARRHTNQFGEAGAERAERRAAHREADLRDGEAAATEERHRALDPPSHQVAVGRFTERCPELAAEVP